MIAVSRMRIQHGIQRHSSDQGLPHSSRLPLKGTEHKGPLQKGEFNFLLSE